MKHGETQMKPGEMQFEHNYHTRFARMWLLLPDHIKGWFVIGQVVLEELLIYFTSPVEVLLRYRFGVRSLSLLLVLQLVNAVWLLQLYVGRISPAAVMFAAAAATAAIYHYWESRRDERNGERHRHTYSPGDPLPFWWPIRSLLARMGINREKWLSDWMITRFGEPGLCLLAGAILYTTVQGLATYFLIAAGALLLKGQIVYLRMVNMERDRLDAKLAAEWVSAEDFLNSPNQDRVFMVTVIRSPVIHKTEEFSEPLPKPEQGWHDPPIPAIPEPVSVTIECPSCHGRLKVKEKHRGRRCSCPACKTSFMIPTEG